MARGQGGGRPKKVIDAEQVKRLAAINCTTAEIAAVMGCSSDTLERRFAAIIKEGRDQGRSSLKRHMWEAVQKGNITMMIFLSKQILGYSDKVEQVSDTKLTVKENVSQLTKEQLLEEYKKLNK